MTENYQLTELQIACGAAVAEMSSLEFFPADKTTRASIMQLLERMCHRPAEAQWLSRYMVNRVGTWSGPVALRGIFCSRFRPKDGVEADPPPGVAAENEMRYVEAHQERKALAVPGVMALLQEASRDLEPGARFDAQSRRWYALCERHREQNVPKLFRKLATEFAVTDDLGRRDVILDDIEARLGGQQQPKAATGRDGLRRVDPKMVAAGGNE